ncbi:MAG: hypothetical protein QF921_07275 [Pseudomonadales bacterium]|jgi:hypothetical protein|nr:hypothetical protein [Pseudomonadales bacterium]MDP6469832.1 hypothetical protein [Pseudomonadales bacterium]MDP6827566.1 hypothetical protein [Pseudomonadales bacterium]MDP6971302.1 hypothetical protein [Pseudomonadales bacterium]|tara:strand:+ start:2474 stop:3037 length:564 start_codon:yes stop_codon:yes gene_type:complete
MRFLLGLLLSVALVLGGVQLWKSSHALNATPTARPIDTVDEHQTHPGPGAALADHQAVLEAQDHSTHIATTSSLPEQITPDQAASEMTTATLPDRFDTPLPETAPLVETSRAALAHSAWAPFHSEYSAHAFAKLMTVRIDRPFTVRRTPSRRFEVVFHFDTDAERDAVLSHIEAVTSGLAYVDGEAP